MIDTKYDGWLELADLNLATVIKCRMRMIPNSILLEKNGLLAFSVGGPILDGHLNGILGSKHDSHEVIGFANQFLESLGYGFVIWIREHADNQIEKLLRNAGLTPKRAPGAAGMVIENRLEQPGVAASLKICKVSTSEDIADFAYVTEKAFDLVPTISEYAIKPVYELGKPNIVAYIIREGAKALAAGMMLIENGVAGLYYIGTVPEARGRGLGALMTRILTNAGFDLGAKAAILQASLMGERLYERLGYKTITHYRWYYLLDPI